MNIAPIPVQLFQFRMTSGTGVRGVHVIDAVLPERQRLAHERTDRAACSNRGPEVPAQHAAEPPPVLDVDRAVEPEIPPHRRELHGIGVLEPEDHLCRIARDEVHERENEDGDNEEDRDEENQALDDIALHHLMLLRSRRRVTALTRSP
ncbi:MAG: hypothetical protein HYT96_03485 [Armatimonadetes bacterium]|nr:hypothetical protein [Armatimonadota bacterium]